MRKISGTGKALAKAEKYEHKSEVKTYDLSGDSTLPTCSKKCKIELVDKEDEVIEKKAKRAKVKIKVEEEVVEDVEDTEEEVVQVVEEQETSVKKKKKKDKKKHVKEEPLSEEEPCTSTAVSSPEKKKKKKKNNVNED
uniref:Uncharacterized protein n=1 Tax=Rangifer tarandus platyrhynchus TaxID=3082113 RepID=A0ACB0FDG6_RANTA|nr:unnamed protein product [Rangifer tarandus platyrhynchus]